MKQEEAVKIIETIVETHSSYPPSAIEFLSTGDAGSIIASAKAGSGIFRVELSESRNTIKLFELHTSKTLSDYRQLMGI